jgi:NDP-sugar pyrophosphorylase family protein
MGDGPAGAVGLVMAGGRGERMAASGVSMPKALVDVAGRPLIERSLRWLLHGGLRRLAVSVPAEGAVRVWCEVDGVALVAGLGADLEVLVEPRPLGNAGAVGSLVAGHQPVLLCFADNVTQLSPRALLGRHDSSGADLTLATHVEPFRVPYGEVAVVDGCVVDYREKPAHPVLVSSGVAVLSARAAALVPTDRPSGMVDLFRLVAARGWTVAAHEHEAAWVDVNYRSQLERAEEIVRSAPEVFGPAV